MVILWEMAVDKHIVEVYALTMKGFENKVMNWPEGVLRERGCAKSVLITNHNKLEILFLTDEWEVGYSSLNKLQFLERVYLLISRFLYDRTVTIYEK